MKIPIYFRPEISSSGRHTGRMLADLCIRVYDPTLGDNIAQISYGPDWVPPFGFFDHDTLFKYASLNEPFYMLVEAALLFDDWNSRTPFNSYVIKHPDGQREYL